jgi:hypothetical protein
MFAEASLSTVWYLAILCLASPLTLFAQSTVTISHRVVVTQSAAAPLAKIRLFNTDAGGERFVSAGSQDKNDSLSAPARGSDSAGLNHQISRITLSDQIENTIPLLPPISSIQKFEFDDSTFSVEATRRQFRFEAFDVFNQATFAQSRRPLGSSAFGQIGDIRLPAVDSG